MQHTAHNFIPEVNINANACMCFVIYDLTLGDKLMCLRSYRNFRHIPWKVTGLHRILIPKSNLEEVWVLDVTGGSRRTVFDELVFVEAL